MSNRLRIAIDMDEVLADTITAQLDWFRERHGYRLTKEALAGRRLEAAVDAGHFAEHDAMLHEGSFFGGLPVMPGSQSAVAEIARRHDIFVASAATDYPRSCSHKYDWVLRNFPMIPPKHIVFCGDKGVLAVDVLIDDNCNQLRSFSGRGLLYSAPHNLGVEGWTRLHNWDDALRLLLGPALAD